MNPPDFDGELLTDEAVREAAAVDFGRVLHRVPAAVLRPGSTEDVARAVAWMGDEGGCVAAQGQRHSVYGRSQVRDGVVVDMSGRNRIHSVTAGSVVVDAGARWSDVLRATIPQGGTPPVLTEYIELSVGGTLVVGGVGGTTWRDGVQSDTVLELEVVTGDGRIRTCSPSADPTLFDAVRAGLGQVGVVTRATLALTAAPQSARTYALEYTELATMLDDQRLLLGERRWDYLGGAAVPGVDGGWTYTIEGSTLFSGAAPGDATALAGLHDDRARARIETVGYDEYVHRFAALEQMLRANGQWFHPHPWLTTFVPDSAAEPLLAAELARITPDDLGPFGRVLVAPVRPDAVRSPLFRMPDEDRAFAFNLVRFPATPSADAAAAMVEANRAIYDRVRAAGGTLNPMSAFAMSAQDWRAHFGPRWDQLCAAKQAYDPAHVLTPGYELF